MALVFPVAPTIGDLFPANPGTSGAAQYEWDGSKWNQVPSVVSLGVSNQGAFNAYQWPATDGSSSQRLTTDGSGNLSWELPPSPNLQVLGLLEIFDGVSRAFTLVESGTTTPFTPVPDTNLVVFLGGVPQTPSAAYAMVPGTSTISFTEPPEGGTVFYAISSVIEV